MAGCLLPLQCLYPPTRTCFVTADGGNGANGPRRRSVIQSCIRQHTSAYVSIRQHTSAYVPTDREDDASSSPAHDVQSQQIAQVSIGSVAVIQSSHIYERETKGTSHDAPQTPFDLAKKRPHVPLHVCAVSTQTDYRGVHMRGYRQSRCYIQLAL